MVQFVKRCGGANFIAISIMGVLLGSIAGFVFGFWLNSWANSPNPGDKYYIYMYILLVIGITLLSVVMWAVIMHLPILMNIYQDMIKNLLFTSLNYF